jgi:hypothetical protein
MKSMHGTVILVDLIEPLNCQVEVTIPLFCKASQISLADNVALHVIMLISVSPRSQPHAHEIRLALEVASCFKYNLTL